MEPDTSDQLSHRAGVQPPTRPVDVVDSDEPGCELG
jgi:hypothetical protein